MASVTIDGVSAGTFDLYASTAGPYSQTFSGLANTSHIIVVKVLGTKNPASSDTWVPVDGFVVGPVLTQEPAPAVKLGTWVGQVNPASSDGYYRSSNTSGAQVTFPFTGTSIDWV